MNTKTFLRIFRGAINTQPAVKHPTQPAPVRGLAFQPSLVRGLAFQPSLVRGLAFQPSLVRGLAFALAIVGVTLIATPSFAQLNYTAAPVSGNTSSPSMIVGGSGNSSYTFVRDAYVEEGTVFYIPFSVDGIAMDSELAHFTISLRQPGSRNLFSSLRMLAEDQTAISTFQHANLTANLTVIEGNLTLAAGAKRKVYLEVTLIDNSEYDGVRTSNVLVYRNIRAGNTTLALGTGHSQSDNGVNFQIFDNDAGAPIARVVSSNREGDRPGHAQEGGTPSFRVILSSPAPHDMIIPVAIRDPQLVRDGYADCDRIDTNQTVIDGLNRAGFKACTPEEFRAGVVAVEIPQVAMGQTRSQAFGIPTRNDNEYKAASLFASILGSGDGSYEVARTDIGDGHMVQIEAESFVLEDDVLIEPAIVGANEGENLRFRVTVDTRFDAIFPAVEYQYSLGRASVNLTDFKQVVDRRDGNNGVTDGFYPSYHTQFATLNNGTQRRVTLQNTTNATFYQGEPFTAMISPFDSYGRANGRFYPQGTGGNRCLGVSGGCWVISWRDLSTGILHTEGTTPIHSDDVFAAGAGSDYRGATTGTLEFASGDGPKYVTVPTNRDNLVEANEVVEMQVVRSRTTGPENFTLQSDYGNIGIGVIVDSQTPLGLAEVTLRGDRGFPEEGGNISFQVSANRVLESDLLVQLYVDGRVSHVHHDSIITNEDIMSNVTNTLLVTNGTRRLAHVGAVLNATYGKAGNYNRGGFNGFNNFTHQIHHHDNSTPANATSLGMPAGEHYIGVVIPAGSRSTEFMLTAVANVTDRVEVRLVEWETRNLGPRVVDRRYWDGNAPSLTATQIKNGYMLKDNERIPRVDENGLPLKFNGTHVTYYDLAEVPDAHWLTACADDIARRRWTGSSADCIAASKNGTYVTSLNPRVNLAFRARPGNGGTGDMQAFYDVGNPRIALAQAGVANVAPGEDTIEDINMETLAHVASEFFDESSSLISERIANRISGSLAGRFGFTIAGGDVNNFVRREAQREAGENPWDAPDARQASLLETTDWRDLAFTLPLHGGDAGGIGVWGTGFTRNLGYGVANTDFDGSVTGGIAGVDLYITPHLLFGVGFSSATAEIDLTPRGAGAKGSHETEITGYHPYIGYELEGGGSIWATLGIANGDVTLTREGVAGSYQAEIESTSYGAGFTNLVDRQQVSGGSVSLSIKGDAQYTGIDETPSARNDVSAGYANSGSNEASASHVRLGVVIDWNSDLQGGSVLSRSFELAGRYDMGDAREGQGVELGAGVGLDTPDGLQFDLNARSLILHADNVEEDWGIAGSFAWLSPAARQNSRGAGLSLSFRPSWGNQATTDGIGGALFDRGVDSVVTAGDADDAQVRYRYDVRYGIPLFRRGDGLGGSIGGGLLMPFISGDAGSSDESSYGTQFTYGGVSAGVESVESDIYASDDRGFIRYYREF